MKKIKFEPLHEELYYEKLSNGLSVYVLPKDGFHKTYATFTTKYGSIDNHFTPIGSAGFIRVPDGIAHFLEHKLFEKEDGDVFQKFSRQGASANAFTSFTRTAYLFSSTSHVEKNLETLLDFVQEPYFTDQTVEKEKGIIAQEIRMYDDNPDWRLYFGMIKNLYEKHPVRIDIAGTVESISAITKDMLYTCYNTFYHPSNMVLFIVGPVEPEKIFALVKTNQAKKSFAEPPEIKRKFPSEKPEAYKTKDTVAMNVQTPKCLVGIKALPGDDSGKEMLKRELAVNVLLDMLFGKSSKNYENLYNDGLVDDTFFYDFTQEQDFGFAMIGGDTKNPDELERRIKDILFSAREQKPFSDTELKRAIRKKTGFFLRALNSPEYIANQFTRYVLNDMNLFDVVPVLGTIRMEDIEKIGGELLRGEKMSTFQIVPANMGQKW